MNLFNQCSGTVYKRCVHYETVGNITLHMGFFDDDVRSTINLGIDQWYHVAFVYDYDRRQQFICLNELLETSIILQPEESYSTI